MHLTIYGMTIILQKKKNELWNGLERETPEELCKKFSHLMQEKFEMSMMGNLNFFLGLQVKQMDKWIFINQAKYTQELIKKFGMSCSKPTYIPMSQSTLLDKDETGKNVDITQYRRIIGSLLYLTASRPDIMFAVGVCARFQVNPKESHLNAVKKIIKYIKSTQNLGLWYSKEGGIELKGYTDSDFAGCKVDRKSTSGICQFLGQRLVSWHSKKQNSIALSTAEAEYIAAGSCCAQILHWWKCDNFLFFGSYRYSKLVVCTST